MNNGDGILIFGALAWIGWGIWEIAGHLEKIARKHGQEGEDENE